jgi:hypothetical protein
VDSLAPSSRRRVGGYLVCQVALELAANAHQQVGPGFPSQPYFLHKVEAAVDHEVRGRNLPADFLADR